MLAAQKHRSPVISMQELCTVKSVDLQPFWGGFVGLVAFCLSTICATSLKFCRNRPEVGGQHVQSMQVKRSDPKKDWSFLLSTN